MNRPALRDFSVALRRFVRTDAAPLFAAVDESREIAGRWLPNLAATTDAGQVADWIAGQDDAFAEGSAFPFAIVDVASDRILGGCGLTGIHPWHRFANAFFWVRAGAQGRGIGPAALRLLARYGLETAGLERVEALAATGNAASLRALEKAGALREGRLRRRIVLPDAIHDAVLFAFVRADLETPAFGEARAGSRPRDGAYATLRDESGRLALVRQRSGLFLPGGGAEPGETAEETVRREVREEIGAEIRLIRRLPDAVQRFAADGGAYEMRAAHFEAELSSAPAGGEEALEWHAALPPTDAFRYACHAWIVGAEPASS